MLVWAPPRAKALDIYQHYFNIFNKKGVPVKWWHSFLLGLGCVTHGLSVSNDDPGLMLSRSHCGRNTGAADIHGVDDGLSLTVVSKSHVICKNGSEEEAR
jgi:hypothetical protein